MIRRVLQSAICLCLSPLLAAQQVSREALQQATVPASNIQIAQPITPAIGLAAAVPVTQTTPAAIPAPVKQHVNGKGKLNAGTPRRHRGRVVKGIFNWTARAIGIAVFFPLILPFIVLAMIMLLPGCKDGC